MPFATSFLEAWVNSTATVLGKRLRPFSLRHLMWLHALESPFALVVDGEFKPTTKLRLVDLRVFVAVCASDTDDQVFEHLKSWRFRFAGAMSARKRRLAWLQLGAYIKDHVTAPSIMTTNGRARMLGAPWILRTVCRLCKSGFGSEETIWRMPIGKAMWYNATCDELDGGLSLGDEGFEQFIREARQEMAKQEQPA